MLRSLSICMILVQSSRCLHIRSKHNGRYDFAKLLEVNQKLKVYTKLNPNGEQTIDFTDNLAVQELNKALLLSCYNLKQWSIPTGYLCPPIPGRSDYIHHIADLLSADGYDYKHIQTSTSTTPSSSSSKSKSSRSVYGLDIGTGASAIYPLLGQSIYNWKFTATDIDETAYHHAQSLIHDNLLEDYIHIKLQSNKNHFFKNIIDSSSNNKSHSTHTNDDNNNDNSNIDNNKYDFCTCNPPFHQSLEEANEGSIRKWNNLNQKKLITRTNLSPNSNINTQNTFNKKNGNKMIKTPQLNFGGQNHELIYEGGEVAFVTSMIKESQIYANNILWFTTLVSKESNLEVYIRILEEMSSRSNTVNHNNDNTNTNNNNSRDRINRSSSSSSSSVDRYKSYTTRDNIIRSYQQKHYDLDELTYNPNPAVNMMKRADSSGNSVAAERRVHVQQYKIIDMSQGQKKSRILAWTYFSPSERKLWYQ